jgi:probable F420-dependent oxidoreductase
MRPFRFGLVWNGDESPVEVARRAEDTGYATLLFPDHTGMVAPLPAMGAAAAVTTSLRIGTLVVNIAFRPIGALAQEAAAIDLISAGRLELGLGTGYAADEVRSLGLRFPPVAERLAKVEQALTELPRLFAGETVNGYRLEPPAPQGANVPLLVGGSGDRILALAAKAANIVQYSGFTSAPVRTFRHYSMTGLQDRVEYTRRLAGERFNHLELSVLVQRGGIVDDPIAAVADASLVQGGVMSAEELVETPFILLGSIDRICERIVELRERYGISYLTVFDGRAPGFEQVVARLAGR